MRLVTENWELLATLAWCGLWIGIAFWLRKLLARADAGAGESLWVDAWRRLRRNRMAVISCGIIFLMGLLCLIGPWVLRVFFGITYEAQDLAAGKALPPSLSHWFGTDPLGRDLLARTLQGGQVSIAVGLTGGITAATVGAFFGAVSGYKGGKLDNLMMRMVEVMSSLPFMMLVIVLGAALGAMFEELKKKGIEVKAIFVVLFVAIGLISWPGIARVVRGQVLSLRERDFVLAARAIGTPSLKVIFWHIIPNVTGIVVVYTTLLVPGMIRYEAFLSFLGLGLQPPLASWGTLISEGAPVIDIAWWRLTFPGACMSLLLVALSFFGDGLRDALDPRLKGVD